MRSRHLGKCRWKKYRRQSPRGEKRDNMLWEQAAREQQKSLVLERRVRCQGLAVLKTVEKAEAPFCTGHIALFSIGTL